MDNSTTPKDIAAQIETEYQVFQYELENLKKEQELLIIEYRKKLEERKLSQLRSQLRN